MNRCIEFGGIYRTAGYQGFRNALELFFGLILHPNHRVQKSKYIKANAVTALVESCDNPLVAFAGLGAASRAP